MDNTLIDNWNSVVGENDIIYHLGDVSFSKYDKTLHILHRLNGIKHLIIGNHEKPVMAKEYNRDMFESISPKAEIYLEDSDARNGKQMIVLCHYAMRVWNKSHHGSWQFYGHSHDSLDKHGNTWGKSMDVGVDSAYRILGEYRPFSYNEIKAILSKREILTVDHHSKKDGKKS